jgi:hypothetical protein
MLISEAQKAISLMIKILHIIFTIIAIFDLGVAKGMSIDDKN